jgi:hypothetical protein
MRWVEATRMDERSAAIVVQEMRQILPTIIPDK